MQYQAPIQIVRDRIANPTAEMQGSATIAWNFFTALYYKTGGTPWALIRKNMAETTCFAGISFYKSRDKRTMQTSIAQIFNEMVSFSGSMACCWDNFAASPPMVCCCCSSTTC